MMSDDVMVTKTPLVLGEVGGIGADFEQSAFVEGDAFGTREEIAFWI